VRTAGVWKSGGLGAQYWPVPMDMPALFDFYGDVYGPGPMVLFRQLEVMTSRDQVLAGLRMVLGQAHAIGVDDVIAALEASTGKDLSAYVAAWIKGSGMPDWPRYAMQYDAATGKLSLDQVNEKANARGCKFHVALRGDNQADVQLVEVDTTTAVDQVIDVPAPAFTVTSLKLDPLNECLVYVASSSPRAADPDVVRRAPWLGSRAVR
jgi:aminopeptidase N